ncbi:hypothetical protein AgCh_021890 [Apium graveolens]
MDEDDNPNSNDLQYESLSDNEADQMENEETGPETESSVKPEKEKGKGVKRKWSKVWDIFDLFKSVGDKPDIAKCKKCGYTVTYNSTTGTGNLLKHQKFV